MWSAPSYWITQGYELIALIGILYGFDITRIEFSDPDLARRRYDVALVLPCEEGERAMTERICLALHRELGIVISNEVTHRDVYVVTAPHGPGPGLHKADGLGRLHRNKQLHNCSGRITLAIVRGLGRTTVTESKRRDLCRFNLDIEWNDCPPLFNS